MSGCCEIGTCEICKKEKVSLRRTYFNYDLKCECHSPCHFVMVSHCKDCVPVEPKETKVTLLVDNKESKVTLETKDLKKKEL